MSAAKNRADSVVMWVMVGVFVAAAVPLIALCWWLGWWLASKIIGGAL